MVRMSSRVNRVTLAAVTALVGLAVATPPAVGVPYTPVTSVVAATGVPLALTHGGAPVSYVTYIANTGDQHTVDECAGGLTYFTEIAEFLGKPYYPIHNECGGRPILKLKPGDLVSIHQIGVYEVIATLDVFRGDTAFELLELPGEVFLQTCFDFGDQMRVVGLIAVEAM
jgi:hypothetical protein